MKILILLIIIILTGLFFTNPDIDDFSKFVEDHSEKLLLEETGESRFGRVLSGVGSALAGSLVDKFTERNNYFIFSTYTIDLDGSDSSKDDWRFVGLAKNFIELKRPESLRD